MQMQRGKGLCAQTKPVHGGSKKLFCNDTCAIGKKEVLTVCSDVSPKSPAAATGQSAGGPRTSAVPAASGNNRVCHWQRPTEAKSRGRETRRRSLFEQRQSAVRDATSRSTAEVRSSCVSAHRWRLRLSRHIFEAGLWPHAPSPCVDAGTKGV